MRRLLVVLVSTIALLAPTSHAGAQRPAEQQARPGLVVHFNAWGDLRLGMTHKQAFRTGMVSHVAGHCAPGYEMRQRFSKRGWAVWSGDFPRMKVDSLVVAGAGEHTARGIHVGSTLRQVRAAYPMLSRIRPSSFPESGAGGDDLYFATAHRPRGDLNFQFAYGTRPKLRSKVDLIVIARRPQVYWGC